MKNIKILILEKISSVNHFTSDSGLKIRKKFHNIVSFLFRTVLKIVYKKRIIVNNRLELDKNKSYIFASNHSFYFDGAAIIATIDRNVYTLYGATEQLYNFHTLLAWLSGMIYVDRFDKQSRKDSMEKMNRVLRAGNSILIFPEGKWNDSENLLCQKLFAGPYNLSVQNNVEVVPISVYNETFNKKIYVNYGKPLKLYDYDKDTGLKILRDTLATMNYEQIEKYSSPFLREKVDGDIHFKYMDERMFEYSKAKWKSDFCWDNELFTYKPGVVDIEDVWKDIDKVKIDANNIDKFYELLVDLKRIEKYDFKNYMNENYRKKY